MSAASSFLADMRVHPSLRGSRARARAQLTAHLQAGAAELQRLLDLLAHRKEREATRG
jgi:hypothetical protein